MGQIHIHKKACSSSWCPTCWKHRHLPIYSKKISQLFDWKNTRHVTLTIDRKKYPDPETCFRHLMNSKAIPQLIYNLKRTVGLDIFTYRWFLEWHKDGYPHWHVLIHNDGMIHFSNLLRYWPHGSVHETYFKTETEWKGIVGYFQKAGYFEKNKKHQSQLPEWALDYGKKIKRTGGSIVQSFIEKKKDTKRMETKKETIRKADHAQGMFEAPDYKFPGYQIVLEKCGKFSSVTIYNDLGQPFMGFSVLVPYKELITRFNGVYINSKGYVIEADLKMVKSFIQNYSP